MKEFRTMARQGDCLLIKIDALPDGVTQQKPVRGRYVLAESEQHHDHSVLERPDIKFYAAVDALKAYLVVENIPAELRHERDYHTHETVKIEPGIYEVRRQRERSPEGFRRAID